MTKNVLLSISGLQFVSKDDEDAEPIEVITAGDYYKKNGKHYVMYDEVTEGFTGNTRNIIKLTDGSLDITKKGISNVHMVFEKNKKNISSYNTPFGSILIGIDATSVDIAESEDNIDVKVKYNLEVNYEHIADSKIEIRVMAKDSGLFRLD